MQLNSRSNSGGRAPGRRPPKPPPSPRKLALMKQVAAQRAVTRTMWIMGGLGALTILTLVLGSITPAPRDETRTAGAARVLRASREVREQRGQRANEAQRAIRDKITDIVHPPLKGVRVNG